MCVQFRFTKRDKQPVFEPCLLLCLAAPSLGAVSIVYHIASRLFAVNKAMMLQGISNLAAPDWSVQRTDGKADI